MTRHARLHAPVPETMSLRAAARIVGEPKEYLQELAAAGKLAVYLTGDPSAPKWRVSKAGLIDAGLLAPARPSSPADHALGELLELVREQAARIASLQD